MVLDQESFKKVLPGQLKKTVNEELIKGVNKILADPMCGASFRENLFGYVNVLKEGKFKLESYVDAVKYVSYKLMGDTNIVAYTKAFPERYERMVKKGMCSKDINSMVTSYNKNKLVNLIYEQTLVPSYILNADLYQRALNTQADLMINAKSEKVRTDAANSILNHLKAPEKKTIELDIGIKQDSTLEDLRATTRELVEQQKKMLNTGYANAKQIADSKIIEAVEAEFEEV